MNVWLSGDVSLYEVVDSRGGEYSSLINPK